MAVLCIAGVEIELPTHGLTVRGSLTM